MRPIATLLAGLLSLCARVGADPTWPDAHDDLEEIMYQLTGFKSRGFGQTIIPCSNQASGPGRQNSAEWLRVAFHDMATANRYFGTGGLDASLQFELGSSENTGPAHRTTLETLANFRSARTSLADLLAAATYASVRTCGGPIIPVRAGRVDATGGGDPGVPQPQNSLGIFTNQFDRVGFSAAEMIQVVACGHTIGGVHKTEFPDLVPDAPADGLVPMDSTGAAFDNKIVVDFLGNKSTDPLIVGPAVRLGKDADGRIFRSDKSGILQAMMDPAVFATTCKAVLQKMIDVVPNGVTLGAPVVPYLVKPVDMQLTLIAPGTTLRLDGYIRVHTTTIPSAGIASVTVSYKDRNGGVSCGSCAATSTSVEQGRGFDDTFDFFPITTNIDAATGISSFTVTLNMRDGSKRVFNNNGLGYPVTDAIILQQPQSCLVPGSGALTVSALVRNDRKSLPVNLVASYLDAQPNTVILGTKSTTVVMTEGQTVGQYTWYRATTTIPGSKSGLARLDVISGSGTDAVADAYNAASNLGVACAPPFSGGISTTPTSSATLSSSRLTSSSGSSSSSLTRLSTSTSTTTSPTPSQTLSHRPTIGTYRLVGCWTEGSGTRALTGASFASDKMTLESCMASCAGFAYWGTEYGRECYCGNELHASSKEAPISDCSFTCAGDKTQYCGAGNRLELYSDKVVSSSSFSISISSSIMSSSSRSVTSSSSSVSTTRTSSVSTTSSSPPPTSTTARSTIASTTTTTSTATASPILSHKSNIGKYSFLGCWTEGIGTRALSGKSTGSDSMTLETCAAFCNGFEIFGTEYGRECWCGNVLHPSSQQAALSDCSFTCSGSRVQYCGAGDRLELYSIKGSSSSSSAVPTSTSTSISTSTTIVRTSSSTSSSRQSTSVPSFTQTTSRVSQTGPTHLPTASPFTFSGCYAEPTLGGRALTAKSLIAAEMTITKCASFCAGHRYFGTEYATECFCGNELAASSKEAGLSECNIPCAGEPSVAFCGGHARLDLYVDPAWGSISGKSDNSGDGDDSGGSTAQRRTLNGNWVWLGCRAEVPSYSSGGRALGGRMMSDNMVTLQRCARFCDAFGDGLFGAKGGKECYCGDALASEAAVLRDEACEMPCVGDRTEACGGEGRLSVYRKV